MAEKKTTTAVKAKVENKDSSVKSYTKTTTVKKSTKK
jgi:hypothetical protein